MLWFIGIVIGSIISFVIDALFGAPFRKRINCQIRRIWRWVFPYPVSSVKLEKFNIGGLSTECVVIEGDGTFAYSLKNIRCKFDPFVHLQLPPELAQRKRDLFHQRSEAKLKIESSFWNTKMPRLLRFDIDRSSFKEYPIIIFHFGPSDFYTFYIISHHLDEPIFWEGERQLSAREKYLQGVPWDQPVPLLANSFGIYLVMVTSDNFVLLTYRSPRTISRGEYTISVTEGMNLDRDQDKNGNLNPFRTAVRGISEEVGIEVQSSQVKFLSFCVNSRYYQHALLGRINVDFTFEQVIASRSRGSKDKWESLTIYPVPFRLQKIVEFINNHEPWSSLGVVCLIHTLINEFGKRTVEEAFRGIKKIVMG